MKNNVFKSALTLILIFAVFAGLLFGVNLFAAPLIAANDNAAELAPLFAVMPEAKGFELIYSAEDPAASDLADVPDTVQRIYRETAGAGYALRLSTTEGYTGEPMELSFAVDAEGRIVGAQVDAYPDTKDMGAEYPLSYVGQDSALPDAALVAGVTYSSSAFKNAVSDGFAALIANGLVTEGVKSDEQILRELLPLVFPGMANSAGIAQLAEEPTAAGGMLSALGSGAAYVLEDGESHLLLTVNAGGAYRLYDVEGSDVTASAAPAGLDAALADAAEAITDFRADDTKALARLAGGDPSFTALPLDGVFNAVTGAYRFTVDETNYYAFSARSFGYSNLPIVTWFILDETGAIVAMNAEELILIKEYFSNYTLDEESYKEGFVGLTEQSLADEDTLITGATMSTEAVRTATKSVFEAFRILSENGGLSA